jgi:hypothetical protein
MRAAESVRRTGPLTSVNWNVKGVSPSWIVFPFGIRKERLRKTRSFRLPRRHDFTLKRQLGFWK